MVDSMPGSETSQCPICAKYSTKNTTVSLLPYQDAFEFSCVRCGTFLVTRTLAHSPKIADELRPFLSIAARQAHEKGQKLRFDLPNLVEIAESHQTSISERVEKTLLYLAKECKRPGTVIRIEESEDYPVVGATDESELNQYLSYLGSQGLIERYEGEGLSLTIPGWQKVEPRLVGGGALGHCFVAMWFDPGMQDAYDAGIATGIRDAGYTPFRVDDPPTNKGISDTILAQIRQAEFVVADFTGQRQSVYFEAGFARGLGREVIWCCREDELKNLHFDIKHLGHVVWQTPSDLRAKLADSIRANIVRAA
jgi:hypothetical protein